MSLTCTQRLSIRRYYPNALMFLGLGELQDNKFKRIKSFKKGYQKGQPDIIISNLHKNYSGFCIEFKTPKKDGVISDSQKELLEKYTENGYKCIVTYDYDEIVTEIIRYMDDIRIKCQNCDGKFKSKETLKNHQKYFHRIENTM